MTLRPDYLGGGVAQFPDGHQITIRNYDRHPDGVVGELSIWCPNEKIHRHKAFGSQPIPGYNDLTCCNGHHYEIEDITSKLW